MTDPDITKEQLLTELAALRRRNAELENTALRLDELRQADEALRESRRQLTAVVENIPGSMWSVDSNYNFVQGNSRFLEEYRAAFGEKLQVGESVLNRISEADRREWESYYDRALQGERFSIERQRRYGDTNMWAEYRFAPLMSEDGHPVGVMVLAYDISRRKNAEKALKEQHANLLAILENTDDIICARDREGSLIYYNTAFANIVRQLFDIDAYVGLNTLDQLPEEERNRWWAVLKQALTGERVRGEFTWDFGKGEVRHYEISHNPICIDDEIIGISEFNRDITVQKKIENSLREANATKDQFFSIIAHDLKNPSIALVSGTSLLQNYLQDSEDAYLRKIAAELHIASYKLFRLLENLLTWSRLEQGKMPYHPTHVDVHNAADYCISLLYDNAVQKQITVTSRVERRTLVYADYDMLSAVLRNLVSNAIKFTSAGGEVILTAKNRNDFVEVSVIDNGTGIDEAKIRRLFKAGEKRISTAGTAGEKGTGLGLILCQSFVKKHGGLIWAESQPGAGTTIRFTLPARAQDEEANNRVSEDTPPLALQQLPPNNY